jgi:hypothetical protein
MKHNKTVGKSFDLALRGRGVLKSILVCLFVINLGIEFGAGLYKASHYSAVGESAA